MTTKNYDIVIGAASIAELIELRGLIDQHLAQKRAAVEADLAALNKARIVKTRTPRSDKGKPRMHRPEPGDYQLGEQTQTLPGDVLKLNRGSARIIDVTDPGEI